MGQKLKALAPDDPVRDEKTCLLGTTCSCASAEVGCDHQPQCATVKSVALFTVLPFRQTDTAGLCDLSLLI